jgi:hypothetical protein
MRSIFFSFCSNVYFERRRRSWARVFTTGRTLRASAVRCATGKPAAFQSMMESCILLAR